MLYTPVFFIVSLLSILTKLSILLLLQCSYAHMLPYFLYSFNAILLPIESIGTFYNPSTLSRPPSTLSSTSFFPHPPSSVTSPNRLTIPNYPTLGSASHQQGAQRGVDCWPFVNLSARPKPLRTSLRGNKKYFAQVPK